MAMTENFIRGQEKLETLSLEDLYQAIPVQNESAKKLPVKNGLILEIPLKKAGGKWRILSMFVPLSSHHRIFLDELGTVILSACDGKNSIWEIICQFAERYRLTFLESRLSIMMFLKKLIQQGAIAIALQEKNKRVCNERD